MPGDNGFVKKQEWLGSNYPSSCKYQSAKAYVDRDASDLSDEFVCSSFNATYYHLSNLSVELHSFLL